jgi:hypothetical protein
VREIERGREREGWTDREKSEKEGGERERERERERVKTFCSSYHIVSSFYQ